MAKDYKETMKGLTDRLKREPVKTPIQEVRPVEEPSGISATKKTDTGKLKKDAHINFWVPDELMEQLKIQAAKSRKTIKQIGIEALEQYLSKEK